MNTSRFRIILYTLAAIVSLAGLADATYLTVQALTGETLVCGGSPDCFRVLGSSYARVAGIPVAAFGTLAYFGVFSFAMFAAFGYARARAFLTLTVGTMFLATLWLLYVQAFRPACVLPLLFILGRARLRALGDSRSRSFFALRSP